MGQPTTLCLKPLIASVAVSVCLVGMLSSTALAEESAAEPCLPAGMLSMKPGQKIKPCPPATVSPDAKQRRASSGRTRRMREADGPLAYGPTFRMLPDGTSRITVPLSQRVEFQEVKGNKTLTYVLSQTHATKGNSQRPLMTQFFNTPVSTAYLAEGKKDTKLVIQLRNAASPTPRLVEGPNAKVFLFEIDFPPGTYLTELPPDPKAPAQSPKAQPDAELLERQSPQTARAVAAANAKKTSKAAAPPNP